MVVNNDSLLYVVHVDKTVDNWYLCTRLIVKEHYRSTSLEAVYFSVEHRKVVTFSAPAVYHLTDC